MIPVIYKKKPILYEYFNELENHYGIMVQDHLIEDMKTNLTVLVKTDLSNSFGMIDVSMDAYGDPYIPIISFVSVNTSDEYYGNYIHALMVGILKNRLLKDESARSIIKNLYIEYRKRENVYSITVSTIMTRNNIASVYKNIYDGLYEIEDIIRKYIDLVYALNDMAIEDRIEKILSIYMTEVMRPDDMKPLKLREFLVDLITRGSRMEVYTVSDVSENLKMKYSYIYDKLRENIPINVYEVNRLWTFVYYMEE